MIDPRDKAESLNQQFQKAFTKETPVPPDILSEDSHFEEMPDVLFTPNGVEKMLENLKPHKASGPDGITPQILKSLAKTIAPTLCIIFNKSYDTSEIPDDWREAYVVPIYKKGDRTDPINYRPVSLTCIACKLMEHVISSNLMRHADSNQIIYPLQYGFRKHLSTDQQLLGFVSDMQQSLENSKQTDALILDFSKAFDKVGHQRLLKKLHHYGIRGKNLAWIGNFLHGRSQKVLLEGNKSSSIEVESGVPQGSVLGPSLFLLYINDLPNNLGCNVRLFADDAILYKEISSQEDGQSLQKDLDKVAEWSDKWRMKLNTDKCKAMSITRRRTKIENHYVLNDTPLELVTSAKYLGVTIQDDLKWNSHVTNITKKANNTLAFLRRNIRIKSTDLKTNAYKALVRPLVEYASSVWDPHTNNLINNIEMVQRRAARYTLGKYRYTDSVDAMLEELKWPSLQQRRQQSRLTMFYKLHNNHIHIDAQNYITQASHQSSRLKHQQAYLVPHSKTDQHRLSFFPRTVRDWNALPPDTVTAPSVQTFRQHLIEDLEGFRG